MFILAATSEPDERQFMISLYEEYYKLMFSTAKKYVSNYHTVEDVVQESLINLLKNIRTLMPLDRCSLAGYIVCTARNTSINHLKKESMKKKHEVAAPVEGSETEISPAPSIEDLLLLKEDIHALLSVTEQLSEEERTLLHGRYLLDLSDKEIAETIQCKPSSVRMKLTRVRRKTFNMVLKQTEGEKNG